MNYPAQLRELAIPLDPQVPYLSSWNVSTAKRVFDLFVAVSLLLSFLPVMVLIAVIIKLCSAGPALYRQLRVGQRGREFQIMKFRTMRDAPKQQILRLTRTGDSRITTVGRVLRKWKLDELPQLLNVILGDMSLVGPRPDLAEFINQLDDRQQSILQLRPGITGWATLQYRNEEQVLSLIPENELKQFYCTKILPEKIRLDLDYAARASFARDVEVLLRTALAIVR